MSSDRPPCMVCGHATWDLRAGVCKGCRRRSGSKVRTISPWEAALARVAPVLQVTTTHRPNDNDAQRKRGAW